LRDSSPRFDDGTADQTCGMVAVSITKR
jgi:glutaredoxin-related protein